MQKKLHDLKITVNEILTGLGNFIGHILSIFISKSIVPFYIFLFILSIYVFGIIQLLKVSPLVCKIYGAGFPIILIVTLAYFLLIGKFTKGE